MKNSLLFFLILLLTASSVQAQRSHKFSRFGAGIYAGPQLLGKIYSDDRLSDISGITAGLDLRYAFSKQPQGFSLHLQPSFNTFRHFTAEGANTQFYRETTWRWEAFHLPLLARYTFTSGRIRPFAEIGPSLRFRKALTIREYGYICGFAGCNNSEYNINLQSEINKDPIVLTAAAGMEIDVWKITIPISVRLQEGLSSYEMKDYLADGPYYEGLKTRTIQVTAGISF